MVKKRFLALLYTLIGHFSFSAIANGSVDDFSASIDKMSAYDAVNVNDINLVYLVLFCVALFGPFVLTLVLSPRYVGKPLKVSWKWWVSLLASVGFIFAFFFYVYYTTPVTG